jgi:uncharacterized protein (DUF3084 family)
MISSTMDFKTLYEQTVQQLAEVEHALAAKEQALAAMEQALAAKEQALAAREQALAAKEQALAVKEQALAAKTEQHDNTVRYERFMEERRWLRLCILSCRSTEVCFAPPSNL